MFLVAATLRPETMYGQTNCWVSPDIEYNVFEVKNNEIFIATERSAKNMAYQGFTPVENRFEVLMKIKGEVSSYFLCIRITLNLFFFFN